MALFNSGERKNGIQIGTVGDECLECKKKHRGDEEYEPESLDYQQVYKFWVNNQSHCMCLNCFKESLGEFLLLDPTDLEDKPKAKKPNNKKKEEDKNASKTTEPSEGK